VVELSRALEEAIDAVKSRQVAGWDSGPQHYHYVVKQSPGRKNPVYQVSTKIAKVVEACSGRRAIWQVVEHLAREFPAVSEAERDYEFVGLLRAAQREDLIEIFQKPSETVVRDCSISEPEELRVGATLAR